MANEPVQPNNINQTGATSIPPGAQQEIIDQRMNLETEDVDAIDDLDFQDVPDVPPEELQSWKDQYGVLFRIWFLNEQYIYRSFDYTEFIAVRKQIREEFQNNIQDGDEEFKKRMQDRCVLWPRDYIQRRDSGMPKKVPGGIPILLGDYILAASGFSDNIVPDVIENDGTN